MLPIRISAFLLYRLLGTADMFRIVIKCHCHGSLVTRQKSENALVERVNNCQYMLFEFLAVSKILKLLIFSQGSNVQSLFFKREKGLMDMDNSVVIYWRWGV